MELRVKKFFEKNGILPHNIIYILRNDRQTVVYLTDGREVYTYLSLKYFRAVLLPNEFFSITKGVIVSAAQISNIDSGVYTMSDGRVFKGRQRGVGEHNRNRLRLESASYGSFSNLSAFSSGFSAFDQMPLAFFALELVRDENADGVDFLFRYCNDRFLAIHDTNSENIINRPFVEFYPHRDGRLVSICAEVALNGARYSVKGFSRIHGEEATAYLFSPAVGFCACIITSGTFPDRYETIKLL